jgi:hypothetical protein
MPEPESTQGVARSEGSPTDDPASDENGEPPQLRVVQMLELLPTPISQTVDPAERLRDAGLVDKDCHPTKLAQRAQGYAQRLFEKRGLSDRWEGIDVLFDMYCWILCNQENCLARRQRYQSDWEWVRWLASKCVDKYTRDGAWLLPYREDTAEPVAPDDIEAQVAFDELLDDLLDEIEKNPKHHEFLALVRNIDLRDDHKALAAVLSLTIPALHGLLRRFRNFYTQFLARRSS